MPGTLPIALWMPIHLPAARCPTSVCPIAKRLEALSLNELLAANRALMIAYVLKDDLKELWSYRHEGYARRFWLGWYRRAMRSRIEPLKAFARKLRGYLPGPIFRTSAKAFAAISRWAS
jgi:hypothetical protein